MTSPAPPPPPAPSLNDLPEETLAHVLTFLPRTSLAPICRVSKKLNRIATPRLYSRVSFTNPDYHEQSLLPWLRPFAYLIFTSDVHAEYVREMFAEFDVPSEDYEEEEEGGEEGGEENDTQSESKKEKAAPQGEFEQYGVAKPWPLHGDPKKLEEVLRAACRRSTASEEDANKVYKLITNRNNKDADYNYGPVFALIVAHLPKLRKLQYSGGICDNHPMLRVLDLTAQWRRQQQGNSSGDAATSSHALDVMVASGDDKYSGPPAHVAAFLLLPNLRALYAWKAGDSETKDEDDPDAFFSNLPPRSISVEAVELRCAKLFHKHFSSLLSALTPGKLKTFQYEIGNSWAWTIVHHGRIMEALKPHYGTLENLELSHEDFYPYEYEGDDDILNIVPVSFRAFEKLRKLKVAPVYIWGHEKIRQGENGENTGEPLKANPEVTKPENREMLWKALPSTLEELGIMRADNAGRDESHISSLVLPALHILLDHASESFPLLKQIYVSFSTQDQTLEWLTDLHSLAVRAGNLGITVLIEITNCGYTFDSPAERRWGWYEDVEWEECINNLGNRLPRMVVAEQEDLFETLRGYGVPLPAEDDPEKGGEEPPMELAND